MLRNFLLLFTIFIFSYLAVAQDKKERKGEKAEKKEGKFKDWLTQMPDSNYVESYFKDIVLRAYLSQKFSFQNLVDREEDIKLKYKPSNGYVLGLGINYKFIGLNIGTVLPFARRDEEVYGKTKMLDLQSHLFLRRFTVDIFSGYYKGQYLDNSSDVLSSSLAPDTYYVRDDISSYSAGFNLYTNLNPRRYSFRGPFMQNERQIKSAGQPMIGIEMYWVGSSADSSFVPSLLENQDYYDGLDFRKWKFFTANLTGGYAYTFVIKKRFFVMMGLNASTGLGKETLTLIPEEKKSRFLYDFSLNQKAAIGYHYGKYYLGLTWTHFQYFTPTPVPQTRLNWGIGTFRINAAYRITPKKEIKILPWKWFGKQEERAL